MNITSAAGVISLLDEPMSQLKAYALKKLDFIVDEFWPEISESIQKIEILYEDKGFNEQKLAALVASKVYYHLGAFNDSVHYALCAGNLFDVNDRSEYVETIIAKCIDLYIQNQCERFEKIDENVEVDARLVEIVNRMVKRCIDDGQYKQALGLGLETRRMDIFKNSITSSDDVAGMLAYALGLALSTIESRKFRDCVLRELVTLYRDLEIPDYVNMCQCFIFLDDPDSVAKVLEKLSKQSEESNLMAYQIAFDMYESAPQQFLWRVIEALRVTAPVPSAAHHIVTVPVEGTSEASQATGGTSTDSATTSIEEHVEKRVENLSDEEKRQQDHIQKLTSILSGEQSIELHLQFLIRSNKTDMLILKNTKEAIRVSVCHTATVIANGFMHAGTTSDQFLRDNLEWLSRATNWAKLTATASLGVIHHGHEHEALSLMQSYLPRETGPTSGYSEGGGLYALGLIHANHGTAINDYLLGQLKEAQNEVVRHGGALGIGLSAMGTNRMDIYDQLKFNLYQDDAVTGEAASLAMGMLMIGSKSYSVINDMISYAQETQHEKILRGLAVGISLIMYGALEDAEGVINTLCQDKDANLRRSGMYTIATAFCGTGSNYAIRKLLHFAVSDVNDDVRRAAVMGIGFILFRTPEQCPSVVSLLAESYNPHVRYGAAMALGIACAGTGLKEAIALLDPLTNDSVNFVRQGALIASAMILIQQTEGLCPKVKDFRTLYAKVITDKHEDVMSKFGAILAQGIIDAGGRNVTISLESRTGHVNMKAVAGMMLFIQHWYWFPLAHCLALAFTPTAIIALNSKLKMPKIEFRSNAKPSLFGYTPPLEEKKKDDREKVATAVLSIAARAKKRGVSVKHVLETPSAAVPSTLSVSNVASALSSSSSTSSSSSNATASNAAEKMDVDEVKEDDKKKEDKDSKDKEKEKDGEKKPEEKKPEPNFEILSNPARVMNQQLKHLQLVEENAYKPLKDITIGGIILFRHVKKSHEDKEELVEPVAAFGPKLDDEKEADPPEPFEFKDE
ncbi:26S proteasome non-ATPase regulatory subunit 1 [Planococcus citri]|uniref:26S proteasome non-ATPase regulatory subunit 1 n=1 Tax=Planococcus citri TaxID=170843 RepID=UPI0031F7A907